MRALLAAVLLLTCPGLGPYEALAQTVARPVASGQIFVPTLSVLPSGRTFQPVSLAAPSLSGLVLPSVSAPVVRPAVRVSAKAEAVPAALLAAAPQVLAPAAQADMRPQEAVHSLPALFDGGAKRSQAAAEVSVDAEPAVSGLEPSGGVSPSPAAEPPTPKGLIATVREMAMGQRELAFLLKPYRNQLNLARGLLIFKAILSTALSYSVGALVDAAIAHALPLAAAWLAAAAAITVVKILNQRWYSLTAGRLRVKVRRDFREKLFDALLQVKPEDEKPAQLAARLSQDVARIAIKNVTIPIRFPHLAIQLALASGFVLYSSPMIALLIAAALPPLAWLSWRYGRRAAAVQEKATRQSAEMTRTGGELLAKDYADEEERREAYARYSRKAGRFEKTMLESLKLNADFDSVRELLQATATELLVLGVGLGSFLLTGAPSVGQVMSLRGYSKDLRGAVDGLTDAYTDGKDAEGGTKRILELLRKAEQKPER
ncbi:MAG TPA: hypothetical protein DCM05_08445 [Elusimicrobia bacterium]|nr:hypothetical protein [Elusimicrobiota bacterium]